MCAKYGRSRMNDVHTISPADSVTHPAKGIWSMASFHEINTFLYGFFGWPEPG